MVTVTAWKDATKVTLFGHGLKVESSFEYANGVTAEPGVPDLDQSGLEDDMPIAEQAAITTMHEIATFVIDVVDEKGGQSPSNQGVEPPLGFPFAKSGKQIPGFHTLQRVIWSQRDNVLRHKSKSDPKPTWRNQSTR